MKGFAVNRSHFHIARDISAYRAQSTYTHQEAST
jgi:hypothetical protein